jgi:hypothetical protein
MGNESRGAPERGSVEVGIGNVECGMKRGGTGEGEVIK